jgi:hypothetical protein
LKPPRVADIGVFGHDPTTGLLDEINRFIEASSANRTACERPCPRAAPVMKATLSSNCMPSNVFSVDIACDALKVNQDRCRWRAPVNGTSRMAANRKSDARHELLLVFTGLAG